MFFLLALYVCAIGWHLTGTDRPMHEYFGAWEQLLCWSALFYDFVMVRLFVKSFRRDK